MVRLGTSASANKANDALSEQCWSYFNFEVVEGTFNITADLMVLITALPLLAKLRIPIQQKLMLLAVFGMGAFVIAAAVLTKVYSLVPYLVSYEFSVHLRYQYAVYMGVLTRRLPIIETLGLSTKDFQ
jgi:hypothetical protein